MNKKSLWLIISLGILFMAGCASQPRAPAGGGDAPAQTHAPAEVVEAYARAWDADILSPQALETAVSFLSDNAVLELNGVQPGVSERIAGKAKMTAYFQQLVAVHTRIERRIERVDGDRVLASSRYWTDSLRELSIAPLAVNEEFVVRGGKIIAITWTPVPESARRLVTAMTSMQAPPLDEIPDAPCARMWHTLAYVPEMGSILLFGGGRLADAWILGGEDSLWRPIPSHRVPTIDRVGGLRGAYDTSARRLIVPIYEGEDIPLETWAFDPQTGAWENLNPANPPPGRRFTDLVYDSKANRSVLFGGALTDDLTQVSAETWIFDYPSNAWTRMEPAQSPPARFYHMIVYDANPGRVLVWGGQSASKEQALWSYDLAANQWSKNFHTEGPKLDYDGAAAYSAGLDRSFFYVGSQFWSYDDNADRWERLDQDRSPGLRLAAGLAYDETRRHLYLFGGTNPDDTVYAFGVHDNRWDAVAP